MQFLIMNRIILSILFIAVFQRKISLKEHLLTIFSMNSVSVLIQVTECFINLNLQQFLFKKENFQ
ncbi:unnamed protein product [Onchocerca flexuosa]|uniref:7TM_GPCR_Srx domain-containing protein n=1 Tax=Onchocerca flexuosa TaxID=387005 RepID=A0A183I828_9BILA|nr:unnamed protein product [Onchocerca flexuosa]